MKKSITLLTAALAALMLTGCVKLYKDVQTPEYATVQMVTKGGPFYWMDGYVMTIYDFSKGCDGMIDMGRMGGNPTEPSRIAKIPAGIPLLLKVEHHESKGRNLYIDYIDVVLTPEDKKDYIVEYAKEEVDDKVHTQYNFYMKKGDKTYPIPKERVRSFNSRDCM